MENEEVKPKKVEKKVEPEKVVEAGRVAFTREGVTILRDVTESASLKSSGWVRK